MSQIDPRAVKAHGWTLSQGWPYDAAGHPIEGTAVVMAETRQRAIQAHRRACRKAERRARRRGVACD